MNKPWIMHYDPGMNESVVCAENTIYEALVRTVEFFPDRFAVIFEGKSYSYANLLERVSVLADHFARMGMDQGDVLTICLPNIPQAVIAFYAANKLGAIVNMVHPKTPPAELCEFMTSARSRFILMLDMFLSRHVETLKQISIRKIIVCRIGDFLSPVKKAMFWYVKGRKIPPIPKEPPYILWSSLECPQKNMGEGQAKEKKEKMPGPHDPAVYLHSGGTTGNPKTIVLSSHNLNYLAATGPQIVNVEDPFQSRTFPKGLSMAAILPLFHGFGLCMCMHTMICNGIATILIPMFTPDSLAKVILREKPSYLAAVPTLFEGMMQSKILQKSQLPFLKACFCGGDKLSADLKRRFESFLHERNAMISLREGYGLTETVTVCSVNPEHKSKEGSIGLPLPGMLMKVVQVGTEQCLSPGGQGEICVSGPTVMIGYLEDEEETSEAIREHADGLRWVHTGDFGHMDKEGYFYFAQRLKRIIKVSGIPVFPSQIESVIESVPGVCAACAIPIPDSYRIHAVKVFVVPSERAKQLSLDDLTSRIMDACIEKLIPYARPVEIEYRAHFPQTLVGKTDYVLLEKEELEKRKGNRF